MDDNYNVVNCNEINYKYNDKIRTNCKVFFNTPRKKNRKEPFKPYCQSSLIYQTFISWFVKQFSPLRELDICRLGTSRRGRERFPSQRRCFRLDCWRPRTCLSPSQARSRLGVKEMTMLLLGVRLTVDGQFSSSKTRQYLDEKIIIMTVFSVEKFLNIGIEF